MFLGDMEGRALSLRQLNLFNDECLNDVSFNHLQLYSTVRVCNTMRATCTASVRASSATA